MNYHKRSHIWDAFLASTKNPLSLVICVPPPGKHISLVICVPGLLEKETWQQIYFILWCRNTRTQPYGTVTHLRFTKPLSEAIEFPVLIDQKMILAKIWKTRRFTVLRLMPPLKGTAPTLHTIQFILTDLSMCWFHFICYIFSFSLFTARPYLKDLK